MTRVRSLAKARSLGVAGSILLVMSWLPVYGTILAVVGSILLLLAVRSIANAVGDNAIYTNMLIAVVLSIVGVVVLTVFVFSTIFSLIGAIGSLFESQPPSFPIPPELPSFEMFAPFFMSIIVGLVVIWVIYLVSAIFLRRSYNMIASRFGVGTFNTASILYLIGAALTIVLIGFPIIFIAEILMIVAFSSIEEQPATPQTSG